MSETHVTITSDDPIPTPTPVPAPVPAPAPEAMSLETVKKYLAILITVADAAAALVPNAMAKTAIDKFKLLAAEPWFAEVVVFLANIAKHGKQDKAVAALRKLAQ